jgi:hypothetical protein
MLSSKLVLFQQDKTPAFPLSAAMKFGFGLVTESRPEVDVFSSKNLKLNLQFSLSHQFSNHISVLLVPSYTSNVNHWEESSEGTFALGTGARIILFKDISFLMEWIPVVSGYQADSTGWGAGLEVKTGGHVFQFFILNTIGLSPSQFLSGGDLNLKDKDFRFGFNIFRWF